jgi:hypothetical protein
MKKSSRYVEQKLMCNVFTPSGSSWPVTVVTAEEGFNTLSAQMFAGDQLVLCFW